MKMKFDTFIEKLLFIRELELHGIYLEYDDINNDRVYKAVRLLYEKSELYKKKLERKSISSKKLVSLLLRSNKLPPMQRDLLKVLSDCKPHKREDLINKIGTRKQRATLTETKYANKQSLAQLVKSTNDMLVKVNGDKRMCIVPLYGVPFSGYLLKIKDEHFFVRIKK